MHSDYISQKGVEIMTLSFVSHRILFSQNSTKMYLACELLRAIFSYSFANSRRVAIFLLHQKLGHILSVWWRFYFQHPTPLLCDQNSSPFIPFPLFPMEMSKETISTLTKKIVPLR